MHCSPPRSRVMSSAITRRDLIAATAGAAAMTLTAGAAEPKHSDPFTFCLNTSTIRGQNLTVAQEVDIAAKAGYQAIEPWISELDKHVQSGGILKDLGKRIADAGLRVESAIGFPSWVVDDDTQRSKGLEE